MPGARDRLDARVVYLARSTVFSFCEGIVYPVLAVYYVTVVGLNPLQLVLVGTALEATILLFEVPTGVIADAYSRRASVVIGTALLGAGLVLTGATARYAVVLAAQAVAGLGYTFISGAFQAWIADEVGDAHVGPLFLRGAQAERAGGLAGIAAGAALGGARLQWPIVLGEGLLLALSAFLALCMPERGFRPAPQEDRATWRALAGTLRDGARTVRLRPVLVTFLVIAALGGMASEGWDRLWQAHFLTNVPFPALGGLTPVAWFGIIVAVATLLAIAAAEVVRRRLDAHRTEAISRALLAMTAAQIAGVVAFAFAGTFAVAVGARLAAGVLRGVIAPIRDAWLVRSIAPSVRATVLSMMGQAGALGEIGGGPVVGLIGLRASLRAAIAASGLAMTPVLALYARAGRQTAGAGRRAADA